MYRPNRIGPWPIADVDQAIVAQSPANFDALDGSQDVYGCYQLNSASGAFFSGESFSFSTTPSLATLSAVGLGVSINLSDTENDPMIIISGYLSMSGPYPASSQLQCILGRLTAAPSTSAQVLITTPIFLPLESITLTTGVNASINT